MRIKQELSQKPNRPLVFPFPQPLGIALKAPREDSLLQASTRKIDVPPGLAYILEKRTSAKSKTYSLSKRTCLLGHLSMNRTPAE